VVNNGFSCHFLSESNNFFYKIQNFKCLIKISRVKMDSAPSYSIEAPQLFKFLSNFTKNESGNKSISSND